MREGKEEMHSLCIPEKHHEGHGGSASTRHRMGAWVRGTPTAEEGGERARSEGTTEQNREREREGCVRFARRLSSHSHVFFHPSNLSPVHPLGQSIPSASPSPWSVPSVSPSPSHPPRSVTRSITKLGCGILQGRGAVFLCCQATRCPSPSSAHRRALLLRCTAPSTHPPSHPHAGGASPRVDHRNRARRSKAKKLRGEPLAAANRGLLPFGQGACRASVKRTLPAST